MAEEKVVGERLMGLTQRAHGRGSLALSVTSCFFLSPLQGAN